MKLELLILFSVGLLFSCTYHDLEPKKDVYVAGYSYTQGTSGSTAFWKNGILTRLPSDNGALAITGSDSHIYIACSNTSGDILYWKDTTEYKIPASPGIYSQAGSMAVSGSDVYLAGYESNYSNDDDNLVYWKNGIKTAVESSKYYASFTGIAISGSDIHLAGYLIDINWNVSAAYWKNGVKTDLSVGSSSYSTGIALSGSDVYVSGVTPKHVSYYFTACYWKNGTLTTLDTPDGWSSESSAIKVVGTDVYVVGTIFNYVNNTNTYAVVYWQNGVMTQLTDAYSSANGSSIAVSGSDVYVCGSITNSKNDSQAMYWKNGVPTVLGLGSAASIFVK